MVQRSLRLVVKEASPKDVGKFRARLNPKSFEELNLKSGDVLEVRGKSPTAVQAWPSEETPPDSIRIDGMTRRNAGVSLNDYVEVRRMKRRTARRLVLSSVGEELKVDEDFLSFLKNRLMGVPLYRDNLVSVVLLGNPVRFKVISVEPGPAAIVEEPTEIIVERSLPATEGERVTYDDIGGLSEQLTKLREMVELPLRHPEFFHRLGIEPPRGVLLYGPPGCGKTLIAKALANESGANLILVRGPELLSKWVGESERALRGIFRKAVSASPTVIVFDEIDALAPSRAYSLGSWSPDSIVSQLITELDSLEDFSGVFVVGTTNRPELIDVALLRPGRFDLLIYVPPPNATERAEILRILVRKVPLAPDVDLEELSRATEGYTGADLKALVREAALNAMSEGRASVGRLDFERAQQFVRPSVTKEMLEYFSKLEHRLSSRVYSEARQPYL
ncbi:MAG: AAA family ATPase [Conexivisphaera sp.]